MTFNPVSQLIMYTGDVKLKAGAAGVAGTTTNPVTLFGALKSNNVLISTTVADTTLQIFDDVTNKKVADLVIASGTNADFGKLTLGNIIKKTKADFDMNHSISLRYADGGTVAGDKTINAILSFAPFPICC